ncbi:IS3 family transposase [Lactovum miscens]|uniref:Transposase InsO family protein n=1 Tax=Lactovum miscens TaxID=190387 RepID=A0A841C880_9LACT|nr:IS3 family transposase [Lactovum miscens]MBB5888554.1 transposase InsO family protein [Lactovum miscens]
MLGKHKMVSIELNKIEVTSDCPYRLTFTSTRAYQMKNNVQILKSRRIIRSINRKENCHNNSTIKNFFGLLKQELYYGYTFTSFEELKQAIVNWIHYYDTHRVKEKLGWLSLTEYRLKMIQQQKTRT